MDRRALGAFLRLRRDQRDAGGFGFAGAARRTPGLRRAEVAELAGISVEHYSNLEQGKGSGPSPAVLASVSAGLRLDADEERHLFELAGMAPPRPARPNTDVEHSLIELVNGPPTTAALILSARYDVLAWNRLAALLMEDFALLPTGGRNLIRRHFLGRPQGQDRHYGMSGADGYSRFAVSQLRRTAARYPDDPDTARLVHDLSTGSAQFRDLWRTRDISSATHTSKRLRHTSLGEIDLVCDVLIVPDRDQHLVLLSAPAHSPTADLLARLSAGEET